jgi:hypothetical protein
MTKINIVPGSLNAILNEQPGPGKTPHLNVSVQGEVEVDWKVELVAATPQGINKHIKLLTFHVHKPTGHHSNAIVKKTFHFEESPAHAKYTQVTLENGGQDVTVDVKIVV